MSCLQQAPVIAFIEDDPDVLALMNKRLPEFLSAANLPDGNIFDHVHRFRSAIHSGLNPACLATDFTEVGWNGIDSMMAFREREGTYFPIVVTSGMYPDLVSDRSVEELRTMDIRLLFKPYTMGRLVDEVRRAIEDREHFLKTGVRR